jgi:uncharacterized protein (TIGR02246 family)
VSEDECAIRNLVARWLAASKAGDLATVRSLMSDDVVFMVPGREPFGKQEFMDRSQGMEGVEIDGTSDIQEVEVLGDWAWMRNRLRVKIKPPGGQQVVHSGYVLTILQKKSDGNWVIHRDANLLTPEAKG